MEGGNEGEVGKQSNNLGLRELRRRIGQKKKFSSTSADAAGSVGGQQTKPPQHICASNLFLITYTKM